MRNVSYRVALGGVVSALCLVTMFLAGIIPVLYLVLPMTAGLLMMIIAVEVSKGWALLTYISVSLLSMLITFDKEAALVFVMLFGHYPILRMYVANLPFKGLRAAVKLILFNLCVIAYFYVTVYVFGLEQLLEELDDYGRYGSVIMLAVANLIFVLYDVNLDLVYVLYRKKLMPKFKFKK